MTIVIALIAFLFGLCLIISIHELGHFMFAKKYNVLCYDYSIGMGPLIYGKKKGETTYGVRAIPLGGFVAMADGDAFNNVLEKDLEIGLNLDADNKVSEIILNKVKESQIVGKIVDRDLYCEDGKTPFIILNVDGTETNYEVNRDAIVFIKPKKKMQIAPYDRCFESKGKWPRFVMLFAGPGMNFLLAIFLFLIAGFFVGKPSNKPIIGSMSESFTMDKIEYATPVAAAGLKKGDKITKINGKAVETWKDINQITTELQTSTTATVDITYSRDGVETTTTVRPMTYLGNIGLFGNLEEYATKDGAEVFIYTTKAEKAGFKNYDVITKIDDVEIHSWSDLIAFCTNENNDNKEITVKVLRDGKEVTVEAKLMKKSTVKSIRDLEFFKGTIGISPNTHFDFFYSFVYTAKSFWSSLSSVWKTLALLFTSKDVGVKDLSGPVGIFALIKNSLAGGFVNYIYFLGFLSVNIGMVNLLPIPALDGGRIVFVGVEAVTKKKISKKVEDTITNVVFILLMLLFVYITFNDILRLKG